MKLINIFRHSWKSIFTVLFIQYLSFTSPATFDKMPALEIPNLDKLVHFLMYAGLTTVLIWDFKKRRKSNSNLQFFVLICIFFPILFGGIVEILQSAYFAPRTGDWFDWLADISGVLTAYIFFLIIPRLLPKRVK
ncbi:MAG TPA: VanZ family protein [Paludibacter sp.]